MDALFHLFSMRRPDVVAINTHTLTNILEGRTGARNHYFTKTKRNIFENKKEVVASYLECGNHWTFFTFAASKGYQGPWKRTKRNHSLQCDSISCGVFTAVFAEAFLEGSMGYLACSPVLQERARLGLFIFSSLDRSGICGICHRTASRKIKGKSSTCSVNIHTKCLPGNQEDANTGEITPNGTRPEGQDSSGQSNRNNTGPEEQFSSGESNLITRNEGQGSLGESNLNTRHKGQHSSEESNLNTRHNGQGSSGETSPQNTGPEEHSTSGESNLNTRNEGQDSSEESNLNTRHNGQGSSGETSPQNTGPEEHSTSGESNLNTRNEGQDSLGKSNLNTRNEGQESSGDSNPNNTGLVELGRIRQNAEVEGENSMRHSQVQTVSDFNQAKRYLVTSEKLESRCCLPEFYSANTVVAYLRKAKGQKQKITARLAELEVQPSKRTKLTSQCSKLCEDECSDLASDLMYLAAKFISQKKSGSSLVG